jgi:hypothetical protein
MTDPKACPIDLVEWPLCSGQPERHNRYIPSPDSTEPAD